MIRRLIALACAAALLAACGKAQDKAAKDETLNFSILSAESQKAMAPLWEPLVADLSKAIGRPVKAFYASNYTSLIEAMRFNQVQMGWFSALPALEAVRRADGEVVGRFLDPQGRDSYTSVLIVKKGSGITLADVLKCDRRLGFGMGDAKSTSGTLAPMGYLFIPRGIDPRACFKAVRSASHETNVWGVSKGLLDVATNNSVGLVFARRENPQMMQGIDTIWQSPPLPESAIVLRKDLDPALKARITDFFLTYGKAPGAEGDRQRAILARLESGGFKAADSSYLEPIARMEAAGALAAARKTGDPARIAAATKALDEVGATLARAVAAPPTPR